MEFDAEVGYALASWARFEGSVSSDLVRAITGAFALVATADGDLAQAEDSRFMQLLREREATLAPLDLTQVEHQFHDIAGALLSDPKGGREHALACIGAVAGDQEQSELVRAAAEIAVAADNRTLAAESEVLGLICGTLGLSPRD